MDATQSRIPRHLRLLFVALIAVVLPFVPTTPASAAGPLSLTVTAPTGGTTWLSSTTHSITWNATGPTGNVKIELLDDTSGAVVSTIKSSVAMSALTYAWTVPATLATGTYTVLITSISAPRNFAESGTLTIARPTITVTGPAATGTETYGTGTTQTVSWSTTSGGNVKVELLKGTTVAQVIKASTPATPSSLSWTVPATLAPATTYKVRVTSLANTTVSGTSSSTFGITVPALSVSSPGAVASTTYAAGSPVSIAWTTAAPGNVKIELLKGTAIAQVIKASVSASAGSPVSWTPPLTLAASAASTYNYSIRITSLTNGAIKASTPNTFAISLPTIAVTGPGASSTETYSTGAATTITWSTAATGNVKIELLKGNTVKLVIKASQAATPGTLAWTPPQSLVAGSDYKIKITSLSNSTIVGTSPAAFSITVPSLVLNAPGGGASSMARGSSQAITWTAGANFTGNVKIELLRSNNTVAQIITSTTAGTAQTFTWTVPNTAAYVASGYKIRITSTLNTAITDTYSGTFSIT